MEEDVCYTNSTLGNSFHGEQKILGVSWKFSENKLVFDLKTISHLLQETCPTKRKIVSTATMFYDPIVFISPVIIKFKLIFQELCSGNVDWDEPLPDSKLKKWSF
jgi:hypothetical protein